MTKAFSTINTLQLLPIWQKLGRSVNKPTQLFAEWRSSKVSRSTE